MLRVGKRGVRREGEEKERWEEREAKRGVVGRSFREELGRERRGKG